MLYVLVGGLCSICKSHVVGHGPTFSPHFNIGFSSMATFEFPLMLVTLHHVSHL
jgi:hypothetical protein